MATVDKLNKLIDTKTKIKDAIKAKGVTVNDSDTFASYPSKIASISSGGSSKFIVPDGLKFAYSRLTEFNAEQFDIRNVTDMRSMFYQCNNLKSLDLSSWDTSNVTDMGGMFSQCNNLESLDLSHFNTSNVTSMNGMFNRCDKLWDFSFLANFDTSQVTDMNHMFYSCNFSSLDLSHFDLSNVQQLSQMFAECTVLMDLKLKGLGTNRGMFNYNNLDLSSCYNINKESALYLFENAFDRAAAGYSNFTIKLHSNTKALLTEEEIAIATNKGFTVV